MNSGERGVNLRIHKTAEDAGRRAADDGAGYLRRALTARGRAHIVVATGTSQLPMLDALVAAADVDWSRITIFHLDEYAGLSEDHPASFRRYLRERLLDQLPIAPASFHAIRAEAALPAECDRLNRLLDPRTLDVAFIGIGENGHLAFNDPPADFAADESYHVVLLDEACRRQQVGEGWFDAMEEVPTRAISMSIRRILSSGSIVCTVPEQRKAVAVRAAVQGPITPDCPASILQTHPDCTLYLDIAAARDLPYELRDRLASER